MASSDSRFRGPGCDADVAVDEARVQSDETEEDHGEADPLEGLGRFVRKARGAGGEPLDKHLPRSLPGALSRRILPCASCLGSILAFCSILAGCRAFEPSYPFHVGAGSADITGPIGVQMWGYVRPGQVSEGIHTRQWARTFVIVEPGTDRRVAVVTTDLGSVTHELQLAVVERLRERYGERYSVANVIIAATHTHAGPGGYWHVGARTRLGIPFHRVHFDRLVDGIVASVAEAEEDLSPARIELSRGPVDAAGVNRSAAAYARNPAAERDRYRSDVDHEMTQLRFSRASGPFGVLNWFAVHPTSMSARNRLISADNKGYAARAFERRRGSRLEEPRRTRASRFVAAFAQTNGGDVTPNLRLDTNGPGEDEFASTRIIAERQLDAALRLFESAPLEEIRGSIDYRHAYVDFSRVEVADEFTRCGPRVTCPSALGYAFFAGSTEDSGRNPVFHEGMTERSPAIDLLARQLSGHAEPSDSLRACQAPKAVFVATGEASPPTQPQVVPLSLVRVGSLVLIVGPAEFTTMSGRRLRETVREALGERAVHPIVAGYANGYRGYVTTPEEYAAQHYEGGHTLYGPWTLPAYQQEYARLARAMARGVPASAGAAVPDLRGGVGGDSPVGLDHDAAVPPLAGGAITCTRDANPVYALGERVEVRFRVPDPHRMVRPGRSLFVIEKLDEATPEPVWMLVATDSDWATRCRFVGTAAARILRAVVGSRDAHHELRIEWDTAFEASAGRYRVRLVPPTEAIDSSGPDSLRTRDFELRPRS